MTILNKKVQNIIIRFYINQTLKNFEVREEALEKLTRVISNAIIFKKTLIWKNNSKNLYLATTTKEFIDVFILRSEIYKKLKYNNEFPDIIKGMNFDDYDKNSAILYTKVDNKITSTCRIIFDSHQKLPIDIHFSLDNFRTKYKTIAEVSRLSIKPNKIGLSQEFKWLTRGIYLISTQNSITKTISALKNDHFKLYSKFGGLSIEKKINTYGKLPNPSIIVLWDLLRISKFFQKSFLNR